MAGADPSSPAAADQVGNLEARLRGVGSSATGKVIVVDNGPGVTLTLDVANLTQGQLSPGVPCQSGLQFAAAANAAGPVWGPAELDPSRRRN